MDEEVIVGDVVELAGRTYLTAGGLDRYFPGHPLLDKPVKHYEGEDHHIEFRPLREDLGLLVARL